MAIAVIMPRQGQSVESCIITEWHKQKGDSVNVGDVLFSYETDKSSFDEKSGVSGVLLEILAQVGDDVPCLDTVCIIGEAGEDISALLPKAAASNEAENAIDNSATEVIGKADAPVILNIEKANEGDNGLIRISPRAKNLALRAGADLSKAEPTGPMGRIIERDVNKLLDNGHTASTADVEKWLAGDRSALDKAQKAADVEAAPVSDNKETTAAVVPASNNASYTDIKHTNIRKVIAKSMHASLSTMAQLTLNSSFDATELLAFRSKVKESGESLGMANITINDMVLFAVAKTLMQHKDCNAHFFDEYIRVFDDVNLGIAVDTERGLMVPTLSKAQSLSLNELSLKARVLIKEAQGGSISPDKLTGGTFTVTNLGSLGIESFTPVINPPQVCILGVNCVTYRLREDGKTYPAMGLSLTFDHRALDGAPAARFLKDLCTNLENFGLLLAK
jgi:pyruvate dehydrogenase E2 component (dihydrolipoamide acetyltransferase)